MTRVPSKNKNKNQNQNRRRQNHDNHSYDHLMMTRNRKTEFLSRAGDDYGYRHNTDLGYIDDWRPKEFPSLIYPIGIAGERRKDCNYFDYNDDDEGENENENDNDNDNDNEREVYLDYAGSALPMKSQLELGIKYNHQIFANPHSTGPAASRTLECIKRAEKRVLTHLGATPGRYASLQLPDSFYNNNNNNNNSTTQRQIMDRHPGYEVLFTSGATEAFKTIAERFPWRRRRRKISSNSNSSLSSCLQCRQQQQQKSSSSSSSIFMYVTNSHNSVVGMRQLAIQQGATFYCIDIKELEQMTNIKDWKNLEEKIILSSSSLSSLASSIEVNDDDDDDVVSCSDCCCHCNEATTTTTTTTTTRHNLLVFPSECNFSGDRPTDTKSIISIARESGWYTMLDIAKHASTDRINLKDLNPDFAALSFYKLFGSPTGVGALLVRRSAIPILFEEEEEEKDKKIIEAATMSKAKTRNHSNNNDDSRERQRYYQGGGSVDIMLPNRDYTVPKSRYIGLASMTSGTSNFRGIANLIHGFDTLERLGGMSTIHRHACCIAKELTRRLRLLKHSNGMSVVRIYGAWGNNNNNNNNNNEYNTNNARGPTVALNVFRSDGSAVGYNEVSKLASLNHPPMQFRTGCFCNPGACQKALKLDDQQAIDNYEKTGHVCGDHIDLANGMPTGAIRASFGKDSIWEDMDVFVRFLDTRFTNNHSDDDTDTDNTATATATANTVSTSNTDDDTISKKKTTVHVSELYLFPIKSCAAQPVPKWPLDLYSGGKLKYDREFAIVDTSGTALRLQTCPKLGLICPIVDPDMDTMTVSAPGYNDLIIRLSDDLYHGGDSVVRVCGNKCGARVWGDAFISEWFTSFLGIQCWLARYSSSSQESSIYSFSNEQPILLISENAVATLNNVLECQRQQPVGSKRFRPNIVIKDVADNTSRDRHHLHIEDEWKIISLPNGRMNFSVEGSCPRCTMVDYDPTTGKRGKTLRALASYRRRNGHIVFGIFLRTLTTTPNIINNDSNNSNHSSQDSIVWIQEGDALECR
jgi:molybdenum cofactor sulfurtransferase